MYRWKGFRGVEGGKDAIEIYEKIKNEKRRQRRDVGGGRGDAIKLY